MISAAETAGSYYGGAKVRPTGTGVDIDPETDQGGGGQCKQAGGDRRGALLQR